MNRLEYYQEDGEWKTRVVPVGTETPSPPSQTYVHSYKIPDAASSSTSNVPNVINPTIAAGRRAWSLLHNYRGCDPQWVELWEFFIPSGGCSCKEGYKEILKEHPFDYSSPDAFFESGVALHNAVNQKLIDNGDTTKKIITLEEARQIWNRTDSQTQECCNGMESAKTGKKCCRDQD